MTGMKMMKRTKKKMLLQNKKRFMVLKRCLKMES